MHIISLQSGGDKEIGEPCGHVYYLGRDARVQWSIVQFSVIRS